MVGSADDALDAVERDRERAAVGLHDQRGHDRQRQRQADLGAGALAGLGGQRDLAAELADRDPHGVHADAAAGDVATWCPTSRSPGGRAARWRGRGRSVSVSPIRPRSRALRGDALGVDAAAVVLDGDDHVAAGVAGLDLQLAGLGLARRVALGRASRGRGRASCGSGARAGRRASRRRVRSSSVSLPMSSSSTCLESLTREVAHEPREAQQDGLDGDHADLHDHRLQGVRGARQALDGLRPGPGTSAWAASTSTWVRLRTSSPIACISWSRRSASTRTVEEPWCGELRLGRAAGVAAPTAASVSPSTAASATASMASRVGDLGDRRGDLACSSASVRSLTSQATTSRPVEGVDVVGRRDAGQRLAQLGQRRRAPCRRAPTASSTSSRSVARDLHDAAALGHLAEVGGRLDRRSAAVGLRRSSSSRTSACSRSISGAGLITSAPVVVDRVDRGLERVQALAAARRSRRARSPPRRWRSSSKTSSISCVSAAIPAKPMVALMPFSECAMRKISSTVSRSSGRLLDAHDREVELLQVLAALGQEHREILGNLSTSGVSDADANLSSKVQSRFEAQADSSHRDDVRVGSPELAAQRQHVHVQRLRRAVPLAPQRGDELLARDGPARVGDEVLEQVVLARAELELLVAVEGAARGAVDADVARAQIVAAGARRTCARTRASSSADAERLGDVVVGAGVEAGDGVELGGAARQQQDRRLGALARGSRGRPPGRHPGHLDVEDHQRVARRACPAARPRARRPPRRPGSPRCAARPRARSGCCRRPPR